MKLQRSPLNPILSPNPLNAWEALNVFNPGAIYHNGLFHLFYRAQGFDYVSHIGYAVSSDGVHFNRLQQPILSPQDDWESRGVEDARLTYLAEEDRFIMAYTAYSGRGITPMFAESRNLLTWRRIGPLVTGEDNKDHVLFPRKVNGRYLSFHRRPPAIWLAYSDDLITWSDFAVVLEPRSDGWDCKRVGAGGVPIETEHGWLVLYHAYDFDHVYRLGVCLLALDDPGRVTHRPAGYLLEPQEPWELKGDVPNVVFSTANPVVDGVVHVYYGGADRLVGLATGHLTELLRFVQSG
jgi:beta-1,2-mannobiose phosphorylase / 1,2-beta-oligomannan phosphorylase